ncbi:hypothetical protein ABEF95_008342 [Exophiala dermatitidis]
MSAQVVGRHGSPSHNLDSLNPPTKRKHRADEKESSEKKKKKKQRTEAPALRTEESVEVAAQAEWQTPTGENKKKKKKSKDKQKENAPTSPVEEPAEPEDVELPDAPSPEPEAEEEDSTTQVSRATASTTVDGDDGAAVEPEFMADLLNSTERSSFYSTRLSLYLSIPAIALEASSSAILATHLAPLLLTYFPPAQGIVLGFSDPVLSAKPDTAINLPLLPPSTGDVHPEAEVLAKTADEFGVCWVWLTVTFLVFRPERGDELYGWTNVMSEGFVGLVSYNYFQTAVAKSRIPQDWIWQGPSREEIRKNKKKGKRGRLRDEDGAASQTPENENAAVVEGEQDATVTQVQLADVGSFVDAKGSKIPPTQKFRVVDTEVVPSHDRHKWSLQIEGTLLDDEAERRIVEEERAKFEMAQQRSRSQTPGDRTGDPSVLMSGALARSREGSVASRLSGPVVSQRHRMTY